MLKLIGKGFGRIFITVLPVYFSKNEDSVDSSTAWSVRRSVVGLLDERSGEHASNSLFFRVKAAVYRTSSECFGKHSCDSVFNGALPG